MSRSGHARPQFDRPLTSVEICAGAGGQAVGLHNAGFDHLALVEWDAHAVETLGANVGKWPGWTPSKAQEIHPMDVKDFLDSDVCKKLNLKKGELSLLAGGVPCPPFSLAGKQLGADDERDLFPAALDIIDALEPQAVMIENVRGIVEPPEVFIEYRNLILNTLRDIGYIIPKIDTNLSPAAQDMQMRPVWRRLDANNFGVPQLRPRAILVAIHKNALANPEGFRWPKAARDVNPDVHTMLRKTMLERYLEFWDRNKKGEKANAGEVTGEEMYNRWLKNLQKAEAAGRSIAPTLVGGSRKHGGADLGPTRAKRAWAEFGINGMGIANDADSADPERDLFRPEGPMLTVQQAAAVQGFPANWTFQGRKTARYRQVGNAFPPPVAEAVGRAIATALRPEHSDELMKHYEVDSSDAADASETAGQTEIPIPVPSAASAPARNHRRSDLVGTRR
ncbi:DNA (cytosine-5-)-methyltransferase [Streptomyces sp. NPDC008150]|uniref:DNA cytosine methyltransferase n=1 Tax=Streptomyces sp. NPDC008150 TaxID=3364816 RepID=UPI0036EEF0F3